MQAVSLGEISEKGSTQSMKQLSVNPIAQFIEEEKSPSRLEAGFCCLATLGTSSEDHSKAQGRCGPCFLYSMVFILHAGQKMLRPPKQNQKTGQKLTTCMGSHTKANLRAHMVGGQKAGNPGAPTLTWWPIVEAVGLPPAS